MGTLEQGTQEWFEMPDLRRRRVAGSVWIPLRRAKAELSVGRYGDRGHVEEFHADGTVALPTMESALATTLGWGDVGISYSHEPHVEPEAPYLPADVFVHGDVHGVHLVLDQRSLGGEPSEWYLHQDLVLALGLRREGDTWVRPDEGFEIVAKLERCGDGSPCSVVIRAEHLCDYLAAREMGLCVTSYRLRRCVLEAADGIRWTLEADDAVEGERWEGRASAIHEGGMPFGGQTAVLTVRRTDVDSGEDVPDFDDMSGDRFESESASWTHAGDKLFAVSGELWRTEWIAPAQVSPRVRGDTEPSTLTFAIEADGTRTNAEDLRATRRYLWFRPEIGMALCSIRGGGVSWRTRETGSLRCSPDYGVAFGVNQKGMVTVFAKDVAVLPEWQRRRWAAENVTPDGGVSEELLAMQMHCEWVNTVAAEQQLRDGLTHAATAADQTLGIALFEQQAEQPEILNRTHRLRATSRDKLLELAKDLARLTADSFSRSALLQALPSPTAETKELGSLKLLKKVLAERVGVTTARTTISNLVYVYDARISDAHLPNSKAVEALNDLGCREEDPWVLQGERIIAACAESLEGIAAALTPADPVNDDA